MAENSHRAAPGEVWDQYVRLVHSMATDALLGRGPTPEAFVGNLKLIARHMEELLPGGTQMGTATENLKKGSPLAERALKTNPEP